MVELKTRENNASVMDFIHGVANVTRRQDALVLMKMMQTITRKRPRMWGTGIIGFDKYHYRYASGHEGEICMVGFSPRSQALTLYLTSEFKEYNKLIKKLGKYSCSKSCLYIKKLTDVDLDVLQKIITGSYLYMQDKSRQETDPAANGRGRRSLTSK